MAVHENSLANLSNGKKFTSENQPKNGGRKPSALRFIREEGLSITDIKRIVNSLIWEYDSEELKELVKPQNIKVKIKDENGKKKTVVKNENSLPMGISLVLGALADDQKKNCLTNYEKLMDRTHGKSPQQINYTDTKSDIPDDPEERRALAEALRKKLGIVQAEENDQ